MLFRDKGEIRKSLRQCCFIYDPAMDQKTISEVMRELNRRRFAITTQEERSAWARKAAHASWDKLTRKERHERLARMQAGRVKRRG
jgi:hypothetical protein